MVEHLPEGSVVETIARHGSAGRTAKRASALVHRELRSHGEGRHHHANDCELRGSATFSRRAFARRFHPQRRPRNQAVVGRKDVVEDVLERDRSATRNRLRPRG